jgi:hypothetical protein
MPLGRDKVAQAERRLGDLRAQLESETEQHRGHGVALEAAEEQKRAVVEDADAYGKACATAQGHAQEIERLELIFAKREAEITAAEEQLAEARIDAAQQELGRRCKTRTKAATAAVSALDGLLAATAELDARRSDVDDAYAQLRELGGGERGWPAGSDEPEWPDGLSELAVTIVKGPIRPLAATEAARARRAACAHRRECPTCSAGGPWCPSLTDAFAAVVEWRDGRELRSRAAWLRQLVDETPDRAAA